MKLKHLILLIFCFGTVFVRAEEAIIQEGDLAITADEVEFTIENWTPQMRDVALKDEGDRIELLNLMVANKKIARQADLYVQEHPELYWEYVKGRESYQRNFLLEQYRDNLVLPDFGKLAKEQFTVKRETYAAVPEHRISSHILFAVPLGRPRDEALAEAQGVLDELNAGADFVDRVKRYSDEPGAAEKQGKFNRWITFGEEGVSPPFSEGLFSIENVDDYSELVQTQYGVHIIRLDGVRPKTYKTYDEVKGKIIADLQNEYTKLAMKDFITQFQIGDETYIDQEAIKKILASYAKPE